MLSLNILILLELFCQCHAELSKKQLKERAYEMFMHGYHSYMKYAYPADELMPLSCRGRIRGITPSRGDVDDCLGNFSLTLIDTLDTLVVIGALDEFELALRLVVDNVRFDSDFIVSVFETNIRVLGGLLSEDLVKLKQFQLCLPFYLVASTLGNHTAKAHNLKGQLPEGSMESLATTIRFVTLNCRTLSSELQQAALSRLLRYLCVPFAALQETRMRDRPVISIENCTIYCGDADENKVGGCAIAVRNDYKNLVEEFGSTSSRCAFLRLRYRRGRKLWIVSAHASTETAEDNSKDAFYDELNALMSKIPSQQVVIVGIDANAKMVLEQQSDVLGKWYYAAERTSDNGDRLVDLCEQTGLIIASMFERNHRCHQLTRQGSTFLTPEEHRKRKMKALKLQLDYVLARNVPQSDIRKSRAVWDVAFDSDHRPVLLSFKIRFHKRNRGVPLQPKIDMAGLNDEVFTKCIQDTSRETLPVLLSRKKFAFASAKTKSTYNSKLRRQLQQDRDNEWTSRAMEFEKAWEDKNPLKAYGLLRQYSSKMKRCSSVLNTANGVAVGEATLPIWRDHLKTLLNRQAPPAPELEHVHRPTYALNEEPPTDSEVLVCRLLNALRADGVPGKFVRLLDDMNQRTTAAVRTPAGCTAPSEVVTGVRQGAVAGPFMFNFAIDDNMRRTVDQCPADIVLAPSGCPLADFEYADDVVIFAESSTKLQHVVNLVSELAAAYGLRLRPDKCKQMWISSRPRTGIRVDGHPKELVDEFCYLGCMLKNNGSYERDVQQRCAKATSAFYSLTKCLWSTPITNKVKLRVYLSAIRPIMMYGSETWAAPSTVMERLDCRERKLLRRPLGYFWPRVCHNEDLYAEIDVVYRRMTRGKQHFAPPSKVAKVNRLRFFGHILRRPADRLVQRVLRSHLLAELVRGKNPSRLQWYNNRQLLKMAEDIGNRLLPAFNTSSGIPYSRVNLRYGMLDHLRKQKDTCTACGGTMLLEMAALSRLTGNGIYEEKARKAMDFLWGQRHRASDLMGTVLNVHSGDWVRRESGIGAGIDSYYEYCLKAYILLGDESFLERFDRHYDAIMRYVNKGPLFVDVHMHRPTVATRSFMDALLAFWPGLQVLKGDVRRAVEMHEMLFQVVQRHKFLPEAFTHDFQVHWAEHPIRPEFIESTYFLYRATRDPHYLEVAKQFHVNQLLSSDRRS
ncbi:hypothetical protein RB195_024351 [Necator americanus]|uniref:alpha-1,2-Mannosidase n=1 Tax=Necator americanus TaxID=51031 RepID=A0ABR1EMS1_NECAM